jgi:hypothetical protein
MSGGPIGPSSVYLLSASGNLFPNFYAGGGGNASSHDEGIGVVASLGSDATAELRFPMPPSIPTGTLKLMVRGMGGASSQVAKFQVSDASCGSGVSPSALTLTSETASSVTMTSVDQYNDTKVSLSTSPAGNDDLVVALKFQTSGWTVATVTTWQVWALWE